MSSPKKHFSLNSISFYEPAALQCEVDFATNSVVSIRSPTKDGKLKFPSHHHHYQGQHNYSNGPHPRHSGSNQSGLGNGGRGPPTGGVLNRESGVVDKLATSYGFIRTNDRPSEERLFFHFSEFNSNVNSLKVGDIVEFEESVDKKSRRRVAINVVRLGGPGQADQEEVLPQIKEGTVVEVRNAKENTPASTPTAGDGSGSTTVAVNNAGEKGTTVATGNGKKKTANSKREDPDATVNGTEGDGKISYTHNNEHFYLSFSAKNVKDGQKLKVGDIVHFQICTTTITQKAWATNIVLKQRKPTRVKGVISSVKDSYGFIERADMVKEIFFHFSEFPGRPEDIKEGVELEFTVQPHRNGKETAVSMKLLPLKTVVFFDVGNDELEGTVMRNVDLKHKVNDPLCGRIIYKDGLSGKFVQIPYGDRDQRHPYTLQPGDLVNFRVAIDRRDQLERAHDIHLRVEETFKVSKEKRPRGVVVSVHDTYGLIASSDRGGFHICFPMTEWLEAERHPKGGEKVEYTPMNTAMVSTAAAAVMREARDVNYRNGGVDEEVAVRVRLLTPESLDYNLVESQRMVGVVQQAPQPKLTLNQANSKTNDDKQDGSNDSFDNDDRDAASPVDTVGVIIYRGAKKNKEAICYEFNDVENPDNPPKANDQVEFSILECRLTGAKVAKKIRMLDQKNKAASHNTDTRSVTHNGHPENSEAHGNSSGTQPTTTQYNSRNAGRRGNIHRGWVVVLKDTFGFIETEDHSRDIYFNMSNVISQNSKENGSNLPVSLGCEVEFQLRRHKINNTSTSETIATGSSPIETGESGAGEPATTPREVFKVYADCVRVLERGSIAAAEIDTDERRGRILRPARQGGAGDEDATYFGLVEDQDTGRPYPYTLTSQHDMRLHLQEGDEVKFHVGRLPSNRGERAVNIQTLKPPLRARVDSVKEEGQFGFLVFDISTLQTQNQQQQHDHEGEGAGDNSTNTSGETNPSSWGSGNQGGGKRHLFFHMSDVVNGEKVSPGDTVEFHVVCNPKTGKYSAVTIRKIEDGPILRGNRGGERPERLKMRSACEEGPRLVLIRQPRGPDGTKGFTGSRSSWRNSTIGAGVSIPVSTSSETVGE